jgi:hypothetical protein
VAVNEVMGTVRELEVAASVNAVTVGTEVSDGGGGGVDGLLAALPG